MEKKINTFDFQVFLFKKAENGTKSWEVNKVVERVYSYPGNPFHGKNQNLQQKNYFHREKEAGLREGAVGF